MGEGRFSGRAKALGIKNGDWVVVKSPLATRKVQAKVTERLHPDAATYPWATATGRRT